MFLSNELPPTTALLLSSPPSSTVPACPPLHVSMRQAGGRQWQEEIEARQTVYNRQQEVCMCEVIVVRA